MDQAKRDGFVTLSQLSEELDVRAGELVAELALLETFGFVDSVHSMGMDQTQVYKGSSR